MAYICINIYSDAIHSRSIPFLFYVSLSVAFIHPLAPSDLFYELCNAASRRLRRYEEPLVLQLLWGGDNSNMTFCLQENQEDEAFPWEEFSVPELQNFLRIVDMEEQQNIARVRSLYIFIFLTFSISRCFGVFRFFFLYPPVILVFS